MENASGAEPVFLTVKVSLRVSPVPSTPQSYDVTPVISAMPVLRAGLNVAVSRAQCIAYVACSARLLEVDCRTVEHLKLANALCRFVELAEQV